MVTKTHYDSNIQKKLFGKTFTFYSCACEKSYEITEQNKLTWKMYITKYDYRVLKYM